MPVEIVWSMLARARLREIRAYVALDKPDAAVRLATRIVAVVEALRTHPHLGRAGAEPGIRELVIGGDALHDSLPCAREAHHYQHHLARSTK